MLSKEIDKEFVEAATSKPKQSENVRLGRMPSLRKYIKECEQEKPFQSFSDFTSSKRELSISDKLLQIEGIIKLLKVTNPDISDQLEVIEDIING